MSRPYEWDYVASSDGDGFTKITMPFDKWKELIKFVDKPVKQLSDEEIMDRTKMWFNIHPDTELKEMFEIKLYDLNQFARAIIKEITE